jgi:hypothetical protein
MYVGVGARVFVHSCVEKCVRTSRSQLNERSQLLCRRVFTRCHPPALPRQRLRALIWRKMSLDTLVRARAQPLARCILVPVTLVLSSRTSCRAHTTDPAWSNLLEPSVVVPRASDESLCHCSCSEAMGLHAHKTGTRAHLACRQVAHHLSRKKPKHNMAQRVTRARHSTASRFEMWW